MIRKLYFNIFAMFLITCIFVLNTRFAFAEGSKYIFTEGNASKVVAEAKKHYGKPYVWAANGPDTFDCSGFITYIYKNSGVYDFTKYVAPRPTTLTYTDYFMSNNIKYTVNSTKDAKTGDIVIFYDANGVSGHMGMYLDNGVMVHAPYTGSYIKEDTVQSIIGAKYKTYIVYHMYEELGELKVESLGPDNEKVNSTIQITDENGKTKKINTSKTTSFKKLQKGRYKIKQITVDGKYTVNDYEYIVDINENSTVKNTKISFNNDKVDEVLAANFYKQTNNIINIQNMMKK